MLCQALKATPWCGKGKKGPLTFPVVRPAAGRVDEPARYPGDEERVGDAELDGVLDPLGREGRGEHRVELGRLGHGARETVEDEPVLALGVHLELVLDHAHHDLVAHEPARVHDLLGLLAELGLLGHLGAEHVARGEVADAVFGRDVGGLGAFA